MSIAHELCSGVYKSITECKTEWKIRLAAGVAAEAGRASADDGRLASDGDVKSQGESTETD